MQKMEELLAATKLGALLKKEEQEKKKSKVLSMKKNAKNFNLTLIRLRKVPKMLAND